MPCLVFIGSSSCLKKSFRSCVCLLLLGLGSRCSLCCFRFSCLSHILRFSTSLYALLASCPPPPFLSPICLNLCVIACVRRRQSKMMFIARCRRKAFRSHAVSFITMACFCLQEGRSEGSKRHLSTLQMVILNHVIDIWPIYTIGKFHDASQCADSDAFVGRLLDSPGNCCGLHVDDRQCRNDYKVSSVSFEECQKTNEGCSFANGCFSCVFSPPGKDSTEIIKSS